MSKDFKEYNTPLLGNDGKCLFGFCLFTFSCFSFSWFFSGAKFESILFSINYL